MTIPVELGIETSHIPLLEDLWNDGAVQQIAEVSQSLIGVELDPSENEEELQPVAVEVVEDELELLQGLLEDANGVVEEVGVLQIAENEPAFEYDKKP